MSLTVACDVHAIIQHLERRLDSLELLSDEGVVVSGLGIRVPKKRIGPYAGGYRPNETKDASRIFYGVYWEWLKRHFGRDISGIQRITIMRYPEQEIEEYYVSREFAAYIQEVFKEFQRRDRRSGDMITNREKYARPSRTDGDDAIGDGHDGFMTEKQRRRQDGAGNGRD